MPSSRKRILFIRLKSEGRAPAANTCAVMHHDSLEAEADPVGGTHALEQHERLLPLATSRRRSDGRMVADLVGLRRTILAHSVKEFERLLRHAATRQAINGDSECVHVGFDILGRHEAQRL